jgi:hypothetical protein
LFTILFFLACVGLGAVGGIIYGVWRAVKGE